jgi:hypothetical protein
MITDDDNSIVRVMTLLIQGDDAVVTEGAIPAESYASVMTTSPTVPTIAS